MRRLGRLLDAQRGLCAQRTGEGSLDRGARLPILERQRVVRMTERHGYRAIPDAQRNGAKIAEAHR